MDVRAEEYGGETNVHADNVVMNASSIDDIQDIANRQYFGMSEGRRKINIRKGKTELVVISKRPEM